MSQNREREGQILRVLREKVEDGRWVTPKETERLGEDLIDDEEFVYRNINSTMPDLWSLDGVSKIDRRHRLPTASRHRGYEYMLVDDREFERISDDTLMAELVYRLEQRDAFYEAVRVDGQIVHAGDDIEKGGEVIYEGHGDGGNAVTGAELAIGTSEEEIKTCQRELSRLHKRGWTDRRKRYTEDGNPYEYWLTTRGYEHSDDLDVGDAMSW